MSFVRVPRPLLWLVASLVLLLVGAALLTRMPAWRLDLTSEKLYTLSQGSKEVVRAIDRPLRLQFYFSESLARAVPQLNDYGRRIRDLLLEYAALNPEQISLQVIDPQPFTEAEDQAVAAGLSATPLSSGGDSLYLGLVGTNAEGVRETIGFFSPQRQSFLEYDISQLLYKLGRPGSVRVGILSGVQVFGGFDFSRGGMQPPWAFVESLRGVSEVRELNLPLDAIGEGIDVLVLINPGNLDEESLYAIDQYALAGGSLLIFVDPQVEMVAPAAADEDRPSQLQRLFQSWGLDVNLEKVTADRQRALRVSSSSASAALPHVGILGLTHEDVNGEDIVTAELESVNLASSGSLSLADGSQLTLTPLLQTTRDSMLIDVQRYREVQDKGELLAEFASDDKNYTLAARANGTVSSAFQQRPQTESSEDSGSVAPPHRQSGTLNAIVVADVDLLGDRMWVQVSNFFGESVAVPWAGNGDFVVNAVENLGGSNALINLRSRGQYTRPFTRVNQLRSQAAEEFKQQEQVLLQRLDSLEQNITRLAPQMDDQGEVMLSPEQQAEIASFEEQRLQTRKQLRQVQRELNRSIEELESRLRWLNMGLIPALLLATMFVVLWRRRHQAGL